MSEQWSANQVARTLLLLLDQSQASDAVIGSPSAETIRLKGELRATMEFIAQL